MLLQRYCKCCFKYYYNATTNTITNAYTNVFINAFINAFTNAAATTTAATTTTLPMLLFKHDLHLEIYYS